MRVTIRKDLGGYAATAPALAALEGAEITKPFVLICGPNGSGKSALIGMMRRAIGVRGARMGIFGGEAFTPVPLEKAGNDLGRMALDKEHFQQGEGVPGSEPGIVDIAHLGWQGQRTWLFSSRGETEMMSASTMGDDFHYQINRIAGGGRDASHGQILKMAWEDALHWAAGLEPAHDPYDSERLPDSRQELLDRLCPTGRSEERWLFLDEPETAIDAEALATGLAFLIEQAEIGRLRVFCASHSFLFAAGIADHPKVQTLDLGAPKPWLAIQRFALTMAMNPSKLSEVGQLVGKNMQRQHQEDDAAARAEDEKEMRKAVGRLSDKAKDLLLSLLDMTNGEMAYNRNTGPSRQVVEALERRRLVEARMWGRSPNIKLTRFGHEAAEWLLAQQQELDSLTTSPTT